MKLHIRWLVLGLLFAQGTHAQHALNAASTSLNSAIPFQLGSGFLILVEGRIGPLARLKFIVDTGATNTLIDRKICDRLSLHRQRSELLNFNRYVPVELAEISELQLGPLLARNVHVMVGDLDQLSEFAKGVDAIIGTDFLRMSKGIRIDYALRVVSFKMPSETSHTEAQSGQILTVALPVQGQTIRVTIDTGLQGMLLYKDRLRRHLPELKLSGRTSRARSGWLPGETATLPDVWLGEKDQPASVFLVERAPESLPGDIDGCLGTSTLHAQMVELDFASNKIRWQ